MRKSLDFLEHSAKERAGTVRSPPFPANPAAYMSSRRKHRGHTRAAGAGNEPPAKRAALMAGAELEIAPPSPSTFNPVKAGLTASVAVEVMGHTATCLNGDSSRLMEVVSTLKGPANRDAR